MRKRKKDYLPQNEAEWLAHGDFEIAALKLGTEEIRTAKVVPEGEVSDSLVVMVGGIPRSPERRRNLPLINKLYGHLALKLAEDGHTSLLYNQPGTGGSTGNFETGTLASRTKTLASLVNRVITDDGISNVVLVGMSAGSYMAARATEEIGDGNASVQGLVLQSPAAYPEAAETQPYGQAFTELLANDWDKHSSPVFTDLKRASSRGTKLLISFFQKDDPPIPAEIQRVYIDTVDSLQQTGQAATIYSINGVEHNFRRIGSGHGGNVVNNDSVRATAQVIRDFINE